MFPFFYFWSLHCLGFVSLASLMKKRFKRPYWGATCSRHLMSGSVQRLEPHLSWFLHPHVTLETIQLFHSVNFICFKLCAVISLTDFFFWETDRYAQWAWGGYVLLAPVWNAFSVAFHLHDAIMNFIHLPRFIFILGGNWLVIPPIICFNSL